MIVIDGSENLVMVMSDTRLNDVRDRVAKKLKKYPGALKMRYRTSWNTKKTDRTGMNTEEEWDFLLVQIKAHVAAARKKKANNGIVPPWSVAVFEEEEDIAASRPANKKESLKAKTKVRPHILHSNAPAEIKCRNHSLRRKSFMVISIGTRNFKMNIPNANRTTTTLALY
jgi:hypothetical protein